MTLDFGEFATVVFFVRPVTFTESPVSEAEAERDHRSKGH